MNSHRFLKWRFLLYYKFDNSTLRWKSETGFSFPGG
ncbi:unnamed protein product [Victoria cruziana]